MNILRNVSAVVLAVGCVALLHAAFLFSHLPYPPAAAAEEPKASAETKFTGRELVLHDGCGNKTVTMISQPGCTGVWLQDPKTKQGIALSFTPQQQPSIALYSSKDTDGHALAFVLDEEDGTPRVQFKGKDGKIQTANLARLIEQHRQLVAKVGLPGEK